MSKKSEQKTEIIRARDVKTYTLITTNGKEFTLTTTGPDDLTAQCIQAVYGQGLSYPLGMLKLEEA